jgi:hypothetical protein
MKAKLVFADWRKMGENYTIYCTELGSRLSTGGLHSGATFDAEITFADSSVEAELLQAFEAHKAYADFSVLPEVEE